MNRSAGTTARSIFALFLNLPRPETVPVSGPDVTLLSGR